MPNVTVQLMGNDVDLNPADLKDLGKASNDLKFIYNALKTINQPLSAMQDGVLGTFTLNAGNPSWQIAGSPAKFSLSTDVTCSMSLQTKGTLKSYYADFENSASSEVDIPVPTNTAYIVTEIQFNMTGNAKGQGSVGMIGINGSADGSVKYAVQNFKAFDPNTSCRDAIERALTAFTLPLHPATAENLSDKDAVYCEFDGSVDVGFGVTYGISTSVGGYSLSEINSALQTAGKLANISAIEPFTASADAGLSLKYNWSRKFQCLVVRDAGTVKLHLFTGSNSEASVQLSANGGVSKINAPQLSVDTSALTQEALKRLTGQLEVPATSPFQTSLTGIQAEVQKYVSDANNWLSSLTQNVNANGQIQLSLLFDKSNSMTSAFTWDFTLGNENVQAAWGAAMRGDFVEAYGMGATLEPQSGFEKAFSKSTKLTLTLFGLSFSSVESYFAKSTIRYGGNGVFYLETSTGKVQQTTSNKRGTSTSLYLDGTAKNSTGGSSVDDVDIQLHCVLTSTNDPAQMSRLGLMLQSVGARFQSPQGQQASALGTTYKNLAAQSTPSTGLVHVVISMSALGRLRADPYIAGNQSRPPHFLDESNWNDFVSASDSVSTDPSALLAISLPTTPFYKSYTSWSIFNCLMNGFTDANGIPTPSAKTDRHYFGDLTPSKLRYFSSVLSDETCAQLVNYFSAGQQYMNLCDDVQTVVRQVSTTDKIDWTRITNKLQQIAGSDLDSWYGPTVLFALLRSTNPTALDIQQGKIDAAGASAAVVLAVS